MTPIKTIRILQKSYCSLSSNTLVRLPFKVFLFVCLFVCFYKDLLLAIPSGNLASIVSSTLGDIWEG